MRGNRGAAAKILFLKCRACCTFVLEREGGEIDECKGGVVEFDPFVVGSCASDLELTQDHMVGLGSYG